MRICKYKRARVCVLYLSIVSILFYSAKVLGIQTIQAAAVSEGNCPKSDFSVKRNNGILPTEGKENYIVITDDASLAKQIEKNYDDAETVSEKSENCMEKEKVAVCQMTGTQAKQLQKQEGVLRVERDSTVKASEAIQNRTVKKKKQAKLNQEWNMEMIRADVNAENKVSDKIKVAVIDSGVDFGNDVELRNYIDLVPGYEECLPYYIDVNGHGSAVAGIIAAEANGKGITGINPNVELYSARVLDENNVAPASRVIEAIYWAIEQDVNIINMSFGMKEDSQALHNAIKDAYNHGILLIAAAGNHGTVEYPAAYEEVMAVGAVDSDGVVCENSARGEQIELVAPGEKVASTGAFEGTLICSGTSMAAPHIAGVASLLWEKDPTVSSGFIRALLKASANGYGDPDAYGNGLVDYEYAEEIYESFKVDYQSNVKEVRNYKNETAVNTIEKNDYVEGTWDSSHHQSLITNTGTLSAANVATIKAGAIYPDKETSGIKGLTANPGFHGGGNYVLNAIYLSYLARDGKVVTASNYFSQDVLAIYKTSLDAMYNKLLSCQSKGDITNKYFLWGIAIHSLSDSFAHNAYVQNPRTGTWYRLVHTSSAHKNDPGYMTDSDDPYIARGRFESAQTSVNTALYELRNGRAWTYQIYQHETYFKYYSSHELDGYSYYDYNFKMEKLYYFAKEIDYGAGYSYILKQATYGNVK